MSWPRTLVFTANAPPSPAASAQVLERLIFGAEEFFGYVHRADGLSRHGIESAPVTLDSAFRTLFSLPLIWRFEQYAWYLAAIREGLRQTARSKWDVVLACHPNMAFALAAAKVARIRDLPLVLYLMDLFAESRVNPVEKIWARITEEKLVKQASSVICLTEGVQKHYSQKYKISPVFIPHCVTESEIAEAIANKPCLEVGSPIIIAYAGGVYQARLDSLLAVKQAIDKLNVQGCPVQLLILGKNDPIQLASWGIGGPNVSVRFMEDRSEFIDTLRHSDILLSTIAFKSAYPLQDQTCFPTKTFDYFLARKPILVVAPGNSNYVSYMKRHQCAITIESRDVDRIAGAIRRLAFDLSYRGQLVDSGISCLQEHHRAQIQPLFLRTLVEACNL